MAIRRRGARIEDAEQERRRAFRIGAGLLWAGLIWVGWLAAGPAAFGKVTIQTVPAEMQSSRFTMTINGKPAAVAHAAANYSFVNFDLEGAAAISITAPEDGYWARGVEVQPWRWGIRPTVSGRTISFVLDHPAKLSITRPGDHLADAEMFFLFANAPEKDAPRRHAAGVRYYGPGVYHENIDAHSGDTIYLAGGAVVFGSLNLWDVQNVKVMGRGTIVYDGPQDPGSDEGWKNLPNWHVIGMHNARNIDISGITCVVRSRTWMIQMRDSRFVTFSNVKVIGGSAGNANQDGMDWLGGGDSVVRDVFIRSADDIFAMYGNWDGYTEEALTAPGHEVSNILIEDSVLSTSISNVVRVGWPKKVFNSENFTMRNSDVIHAGIGGCGVPFALFEIWADPAGKGRHSGFLLEDIRLEDWYSLLQIRQPEPAIWDVRLDHVWAIESPSLVPSVLKGEVNGVSITNFKVGSELVRTAAQVPVETLTDAGGPVIEVSAAEPVANFVVVPGAVRPGGVVTFDASGSSAGADGTGAGGGARIVSYEWTFGDGTSGTGVVVRHRFADAEGTLRDGSGRFRVLLKVTDSAARKRDEHFGIAFDGFLRVPADGGYTFTLLARDAAEIRIGSSVVASSPKAVPQVCGSVGNAVQTASGTIGLKAGLHPIHVAFTHGVGENDFEVLWQRSGEAVEAVPAGALTHSLH